MPTAAQSTEIKPKATRFACHAPAALQFNWLEHLTTGTPQPRRLRNLKMADGTQRYRCFPAATNSSFWSTACGVASRAVTVHTKVARIASPMRKGQ